MDSKPIFFEDSQTSQRLGTIEAYLEVTKQRVFFERELDLTRYLESSRHSSNNISRDKKPEVKVSQTTGGTQTQVPGRRHVGIQCILLPETKTQTPTSTPDLKNEKMSKIDSEKIVILTKILKSQNSKCKILENQLFDLTLLLKKLEVSSSQETLCCQTLHREYDRQFQHFSQLAVTQREQLDHISHLLTPTPMSQ